MSLHPTQASCSCFAAVGSVTFKTLERVLLVLALLLPPVVASAAKPRVAVLEFSGPSGGAARQAILRGLKGKVKALPPSEYGRVAKELGVESTSGDGIAQVCAKLGCDAVVIGSVAKKKRRFTLAVVVYDGGTGKVLGRKAATVRGQRRVGGAGIGIGARLLPLIKEGKAAPGGAPPTAVAVKKGGKGGGRTPKGTPPPAPTPAPPPEPVAAAEPILPPEPASKPSTATEDDDVFAEKKRNAELEREKTRSKRKRGFLWGLLDVSVAIGMSGRKSSVDSPTIRTSSYEGALFPEITLRLDVYPAAPFVSNFVRNIGVGLAYSRHLSISTKYPDDQQQMVEVGTSSQEILVDLRVRWPFWDRSTSPVLVVLAGGGLRDFSLDPNVILTSFNYRFLRFGVEGTVPILTPLIALHAGVDFRPLLGVGAEAVDALGERSGGFAYAIRAGVSGALPVGLFYFATFEWLHFGSSFDGRSDLAGTAGDVSPVRIEASSSSDRFIRLMVGVGFTL